MIHPLFVDRTIIGYIGSVFHTVDIGGAPSPHARDSYEEGICVPIQKVLVKEEENDTLFDFLWQNLREPTETLGDLRAQFAANRVASERIRKILRDEGLRSLDEITSEVMNRSEESMRSAIGALPDGVYCDELQTDGCDEPLRLQIAIAIEGSNLVVDYAGSSHGTNASLFKSMPYDPLKAL